jgi:glycerophosphoryl diester phosphodiesterase
MDGELVAFHDAQAGRGSSVGSLTYVDLCRRAGYEVPTTSRLLRLLAGQAGAHIDLKEPDCAAAIASDALSVLEPARIIVTSGDEAAIGELRDHFPAVPAGLTIGGDLARSVRYLTARARGRLRSRVDAVTAVNADWAVVHERLARAGVLALCRSRGLATMVWTVNADAALDRWLSSPEVDMVVTDRPFRAAELRRLPGRGPGVG